MTSRKVTLHDGRGLIPQPWDVKRRLFLPIQWETEFQAEGVPLVLLEFEAFPWHEGVPVTPVCVRVEVKRTSPGPTSEITAKLRLPLAKYMRYAVIAAAAPIETFQPRRSGLVEPWKTSETVVDLLKRRRGHPRLEETLDLAQVAAVYRAGQPKGLKALEERYYVSHSTANRYKNRAEQAGLLGSPVTISGATATTPGVPATKP